MNGSIHRAGTAGRGRRSLLRCRRLGRLAAVTLAGLAFTGAAHAASPVGAVRVQEDWVIEVGTPVPNQQGPQITTAMSSTELLADVHLVYETNHRTLPNFVGGGMQLQTWSGDLQLTYKDNGRTALLNTPNEVVTYTTSMKIGGGKVTFDVLNGNSTTWGTFGSPGVLTASLDTPQNNLDRYSPDVSVKNSRVGFGGHMIKRFYLKEVRYYNSNGTLLLKDTTPRFVLDNTVTP